MRIDTLLNDEIQNEFNDLKKIELGTEKYKTTVDGLTKLVDRAIEMNRIDMEFEEKAEAREIENSLKQEQLKEEKSDRFVKNSIAIAGVVLPVVVTVWGTLKSLKFEENGSVTTIVGRGFINKLLPKK